MEKLQKLIKENWMIVVVVLVLGAYYIYRMFKIVPWYDEIYTYIRFIDKGPLYSATHWPAPNNHIFFSILSSLIKWCGRYIGLRGISCLSAIGTLIFLYKLFNEVFSKASASVIVLLYSLLILTNSLAVQGRGYSLATFFLVMAIYCGYMICYREIKIKEYILWGVSLWLGLYTLVSSVYWVVAVCLCCGVVLLFMRKYRVLLKLIISSLIAAIMTFISYAVIWLSIGAQQISNDVSTGYFGADIWYLIKEFPRTCLTRGMEFMLTDRNVQSIDRGTFFRDFNYFARDILRALWGDSRLFVWYFYILIVVVCICLLLFLILGVTKKYKYLFILALSSVGFLGIFLSLAIQSAYPFVRVFSFLGVFLIMPAGLLCGILLDKLIDLRKILHIQIAGYAVFILFVGFVSLKLWSPIYMREYEYLDYYAYDAIQQVDWTQVDTCLVSDVYVKQQLEFHNVTKKENIMQIGMGTPDIILTKKSLIGGGMELITESDLETYSVSNREIIYENELYIVYGE